MNEAFVDFTGGVGEVLYLRQNTPGLFSALRHALVKESLVGATALVRAEPHQDQSSAGDVARVEFPVSFFSQLLLLGNPFPQVRLISCKEFICSHNKANFRHGWIQVSGPAASVFLA
jgi:hypothetical protein